MISTDPEDYRAVANELRKQALMCKTCGYPEDWWGVNAKAAGMLTVPFVEPIPAVR